MVPHSTSRVHHILPSVFHGVWVCKAGLIIVSSTSWRKAYTSGIYLH